MRTAFTTILLTLVVVAGCGGPGSAHQVDRETIEGVEVVTNRGGPLVSEAPYSVTEVLTLVQDPERPESLLFEPRDLLRGSDGNYYVADAGNQRVAVFDAAGRYQRSIGRAGQGPGEFSEDIRFTGSFDGEIQVFDGSIQRTQRFALDGTLIDTIARSADGRQDLLVREPDGTIVTVRTIADREGEVTAYARSMAITAPGADGPGPEFTSVSLAAMVSSLVHNDDGSVAVTSVQLPFSGESAVLRAADLVAVVNGESGEIAWHRRDGALIRRGRIERPRVPVSAAMQAAFEEGWKRQREQLIAEGFRFVAPIPDLRYPEIAGRWRDIYADDRGYLWLRDTVHTSEREDGDSYRYEIVAPDGEWVGVVDLAVGQFRVQESSLLGIDENPETGEARLRVFELAAAAIAATRS